MFSLEFIKIIIFGIIEGITEWLPVSSTGHLILAEQFFPLSVSDEFFEMFLVVIQLGAIMAVVVMFWNKIFPFSLKKGTVFIKQEILTLWAKILLAVLPAIVIGLPFDDLIDKLFYTPQTVALMLIAYGIIFLVIEGGQTQKKYTYNNVSELTFKAALFIGIFQVLALIPGTSRSGATIIGAILIGTSREAAAEFTFYLAIPVMFGASLLKTIKFGVHFTSFEITALIIGVVTAFLVSIAAIRFLMDYVRKHNFKIFGWYRIIFGAALLIYFI